MNVMETGKFRDSVHTGMDALTVVSDEANIQNAPGVKKANNELHSVGLGVMNLHEPKLHEISRLISSSI
ncbi:hypothetical protein, partial [Salmonella enterica]|uniref:hypothetical protein n=1 Tax=Salmonella enterica TaxID=28901 RepID=UPI00301359D6